METPKNESSWLQSLWPSSRAQWSAFFAILLLFTGGGDATYASAAGILGFLTGGFLLFYFPVTWAYRALLRLPTTAQKFGEYVGRLTN